MPNSVQSDDQRILDIRPIAPRDRHPLIFNLFDNLERGESFVLVNDHEPRPLYYQFSAERAGTFKWESVENGPDVWKVRIEKQ